jgi:hypothetical protein
MVEGNCDLSLMGLANILPGIALPGQITSATASPAIL